MTGLERTEMPASTPSGWGRALAAGGAAGLVFAVVAGVWDHLEGEQFPSLKWFIGVPLFTVLMILWYRFTDKRARRK